MLEQSGLPLTVGQFWWYSFCYWGIFAVITFGQLMMLWLLKMGVAMQPHEMFVWLLDGLFWWSTTPLVLYASIRVPVAFKVRDGSSIIKPILFHLCIVTFLNIFINVLHFYITNPLMYRAVGRMVPLENYLFSFFIAYTASFGQYLLLVVGFNKVSYIYRYQQLKQQHFESELHNEQLRGQLANAQLQSLKMQLNPHFLFNTLHSVVSLMVKNDIRKATLMITTLSDLLRAVLVNQSADFIPLQEELKLTRQYLDIQQIRFQDRLKVEYHIDPASELYPVPQLILQPIVENSITHGISDMTTNALISITSHVSAAGMQVTVYDNGLGAASRKTTKGMGLGLQNTLLRLQQAYGTKARLEFQQPVGGGTSVTLHFEGRIEQGDNGGSRSGNI
ncbi:sensor histidine kinase [Dyadobacter fermentans]|uniref:Signal transduction histidine kinase, LytS n=1 Tax=Dyadobacter fermentans (strain ATCC 700827 / DSM 18053 / CIP 107007 / KCTC 52180 / NS114) TaxID=471854 RepID=C6W417_DYAFD|nr:histidine kinase [Dyadobacter fermentans]ACT92254.1 signal transduction histidine kinase, LytS [Dyadobacter fermentans DSM 18053]